MHNFWFASSVIFGIFYFYILFGTVFGFIEPNAIIQICGCYFIIRYWINEALKTWNQMKVENNG